MSRYVFINKDTDMVSQIFDCDEYPTCNENWHPGCYMIIDENDIVDSYDLMYDKEKEVFIEVENLDNNCSEVIDSEVDGILNIFNNFIAKEGVDNNIEMNKLKEENKSMREELDLIKEKLKALNI